MSRGTDARRPTRAPGGAHAGTRPAWLRLFAVVMGCAGTVAFWNSSRAGTAAVSGPAPGADSKPSNEERGIGGQILDPAGNPARWALVRAVSAEMPDAPRMITTGIDGSFRIARFEAKTVRIVAEHESGIVESAEVPADSAGHMVLVLEGAPDVHGLVLDDGGRPITKATVKIDAVPAWFERIAVTDNRGEYTLRLVPPGARSLLVWARGFETRKLALGNAPSGNDIRLTRLRPIAGVVVDPWGMPVSGARISACIGRETERAISNRNGTFELPATVVGCPVQAQHPRFSASYRFTIGNRSQITVRMLPGGAIEGMALDEKGRPLSSASVGFESLEGETVDTSLVDRMFDTSGGVFRFDHLSPGTYVLVAKAPGRSNVTSEPIQVEPGRIVRGIPMVFSGESEPSGDGEHEDGTAPKEDDQSAASS
jgi:hypothetical protein